MENNWIPGVNVLFDDNNTQFYQNVNEPLKYGKHPEDELFQTDVLILDGKKNTFTPHFNYKGFQYVEVSSDKPLEQDKQDMTPIYPYRLTTNRHIRMLRLFDKSFMACYQLFISVELSWVSYRLSAS